VGEKCSCPISMRYLLIILLLWSCYLPKRAERQLDKVQSKYPELLAKKSAELYPIKQRIDSVEFVKWKDSIIYVLSTTSDTITNISIDTISDCTQLKKRLSIANELLRRKVIPSKIAYIEDSSKIFILNKELQKSNVARDKYMSKYLFWIKFSVCILIILVLLLAILLIKSYFK